MNSIRYIINDNDINNVIEVYEYAMKLIQGFKYGDVYVIRDLRKEYGKQQIWQGSDYNELILQVKVERARLAFKLTAEKIIE